MPEILDTHPDDEPELAELQQREQDYPAVRVAVNGPVQVHDLPARVGVMRSLQLGTQTQPIASPDYGRKSLLLLALTDDIFIGTSAASVTDGSAAFWPRAVPLTIRHTDALFVRAAATGTVLTVISESWAYAG